MINVEVIGLISRNKVRIVYEIVHVTGYLHEINKKTFCTLLN